MVREPKAPKSSTGSSATVSIVIHAAVIGIIFFFAAREGMLGKKLQTVFAELVPKKPDPPKEPEPPKEKPPEPTPPKDEPKPAETPKNAPPPINSAPDAAAELPNRSVAPAVGGSGIGGAPLVRRAVGGTGTGLNSGTSGGTNAAQPRSTQPSAARRTETTKSAFDTEKMANAGKIEQLLEERASASTVQDSVGAEQISRGGNRSAADVVTKITGVTVVGGKFAVVRGLSDRYNVTSLNGVEVPTADPYRRSAPIDIFAADIIEKVVTTKTFTPDQDGSTSGASINVVTKSFPALPFVKFSFGQSFNDQSNLRSDFFAASDISLRPFDIPAGPSPIAEELRAAAIADPRANPALAATQNAAFAKRPNGGVERSAPLNSSFNVSLGQTSYLFDRRFGFFGSFNYARSFSQYAADYGRYLGGNLLNPSREGVEDRSQVGTDYGASVNLAWLVHPDHELGFNFLMSRSLEDETRRFLGNGVDVAAGFGEQMLLNQVHFTERGIENYQLRGRHVFHPPVESRFDWQAALAQTEQNEPDHRFFDGVLDLGSGQVNINQGWAPNLFPARFFRESSETANTLKGDLAVPFTVFGHLPAEVKSGLAYNSASRDFFERRFDFAGSSVNDVNEFEGRLRTALSQPYEATRTVSAFYGMIDVPVTARLRLIGGARFEETAIDVERSNRRPSDPPATNLRQTDVLPAVSLLFTVSPSMNIRLGYGQTVARPSFRELAGIDTFDPGINALIRGNPALKMSAIENYDARFEWFPGSGEVVSAGIFYKKLKDPIERVSTEVDDAFYTFDNRSQAKVYGLEVELRKSFAFLSPQLAGLSLGLNGALMESEVPLTPQELLIKRLDDPAVSANRPLYDQSPYILNVDLNWDLPTGTSFSATLNLTGARVILATTQGPDIYEHPPALVDLNLSQKIGKNWKVRVGVRNLLDGEFSQNYGDSPDGPVFYRFTRGRTYSLSLTGEF